MRKINIHLMVSSYNQILTPSTPNTGNAGTSVNISLTGTNLTGVSLVTTNPGILVRNVVTTPSMHFLRLVK